ncbi:MAG: hypothetical protein N2246_06690, partial [Candidatus Sumerlaeia bacterium]|nr:hypothetical protein [Candidatus Sumerlaeia bacterium]
MRESKMVKAMLVVAILALLLLQSNLLQAAKTQVPSAWPPHPTWTPRPTPTGTPMPTMTPRPTWTPWPTMTPRPTFTPRPTPTATPAQLITVQGVILNINYTSGTLVMMSSPLNYAEFPGEGVTHFLRGYLVVTDESTIIRLVDGTFIKFEELAIGNQIEVTGEVMNNSGCRPLIRVLADEIIKLADFIPTPTPTPAPIITFNGVIHSICYTSGTMVVSGTPFRTEDVMGTERSQFSIRYLVLTDESTIITQMDGTSISFEDLKVGNQVKVTGELRRNTGALPLIQVMADEIVKLADTVPTPTPTPVPIISLQGVIQHINYTSDTLIVIGRPIVVNELATVNLEKRVKVFQILTSDLTIIKLLDGTIVNFDDLAVGNLVQVTGQVLRPDRPLFTVRILANEIIKLSDSVPVPTPSPV